MSEPLRIVIVATGADFSACCLDDPGFVLFGATIDDLKSRLERELQLHFGEPVAYWIVSEPTS